MGTLYIDTGGATTNSGCTDQNSPNLSGSAATVASTVVTLDGSPDLSALVTSGATQSSIFIADATNTNQKIFWITAFDDTLNTVTVSVAPTGVTSSAWAIGGWFHLGPTGTPANASIEGAVRAGDRVRFKNSPAAQAATIWTFRTAGDETSGVVTVEGETGGRPVFNTTNTSSCVSAAVSSVTLENVEVDQDGASGSGVVPSSIGMTLFNVKISDTGTAGVFASNNGHRFLLCEISGSAGDAIIFGTGLYMFGNYIHDCTGDAIEVPGNVNFFFDTNIIDTMGGRGILFTSTIFNSINLVITGNTIYGCGNSGLEIPDVGSFVTIINNIFMNNGDAAGEYNLELGAAPTESFIHHSYNCFYKSSNNLSNATAGATETTSDPLLTDPANADFTLGDSSPCKATGFPGAFLGGSTGYRDMGAVQRQEAAGGGGGMLIHPGMSGGIRA